MKNAIFTMLLSLFLVYAMAQKPVHLNVDNIYCIGNGKMAAYFSKADMIQLFGVPYSSPNMMEMILRDTTLVIESKREPGTAIWKHTIKKDKELLGTITDFVDARNPVLIRKFNLSQSISFSLSISDDAEIIPNPKAKNEFDLNGAYLIESPRGKAVYNDYPMPFRQYMQMASNGTVFISEKTNEIVCKPGTGALFFIGGPLYPDCVKNSQIILNTPVNDVLEDSRKWWTEFTDRRTDFENLLPEDLPQREKLLQTIDDVAVNIKTQQAIEGGVLAGHNYHLGYVRDQYGVSRCLLKLGYIREAKQILDFYWNVWQKHGQIKNAQGMGIDVFHIHENDQVEITGYFIIQAFNYLDHSKDDAYIKEIFPMLEWAFNCQVRNLVENMLPFNGDETYVAGGVLPRYTLNDGSAEATLLFITCGDKLIPWIEKNGLWGKEKLEQSKLIIKSTKDKFRSNFIIDGILYANNPERIVGLELPQFRHGVCESMDDESCRFFGWTQKNENNRYLCSYCFAKKNLGAVKPKRFNIQSVSLIPLYIEADLFDKKEISAMVDRITALYNTSGKFPSRPDGNVTVGYDYGLLLYNLSKLNHPLSEEIYTKMLSVLDQTGAWVEYYENEKPKGTRYRPWESAINLEAAIEFAINYR